MNMSISKKVVVVLSVVVGIFMVSPAIAKEKVKLSGAEISELLIKPGAFIFGITYHPNIVWVAEPLKNGKRKMFWRSLSNPIVWGTDIGDGKVVGDKMCVKWTMNPEMRFDVYRVGQDKYEFWLGGKLNSTWFRALSTYKEKNDKVKLTGAEVNSLYGVFVGIQHNKKGLWIRISPKSGKQELYWRSFLKPDFSLSMTGTTRIEGDQICMKFTFGPETCYDFYKVGDDEYESWSGGSIVSSIYQLK